MKIRTTAEAEKERMKQPRVKPSWEILKTDNIVLALHTARDNGWKENKVQVRYEKNGELETYYVEPYEPGCGCKGVLKYREYFD